MSGLYLNKFGCGGVVLATLHNGTVFNIIIMALPGVAPLAG